MLLIILWLIQDFLTVLNGGEMHIPGLFMLGLVYNLSFNDSSDVNLRAIWSAFAGGILWDLRWIGIPGFFTLGNVCAVLIFIKIWGAVPPQGHTGFLFFILMEISQIVPPLLPILILAGSTAWNFFLLQQVYSLPAILVTMYLFFKKIQQNLTQGR